eukprot:CAMPEP_0171173182 /NCGR_PEP_ID=MMETSP0790-20130122/10094_1 /TAXON_ID=2925 /ORGANISM="Alexandrium catenella, Strain OF101" /LENGTH=215 /DNA_ID=CAMNT_0011638045 /DNA_START=485 /DNA_END=1132 /DNA_ORIENTATION=+
MSTLPKRLGVPRSLLLRKIMPVSAGASFTACVIDAVKLGRAAASSSSTSSGRVSLAASRQAATCEAQQPRSPGDILMVTDLYQKKSCDRRAVLHFCETSPTGGGAALPSTAGSRRTGSQGACLATLFCTLSHRSGRVSRLMTTASTPCSFAVGGFGRFLSFARMADALHFCRELFLGSVLSAFLLVTVRFTDDLADGMPTGRQGGMAEPLPLRDT